MEKIFDIAKDSEKSWGVIAQGIDRNFEELSNEAQESNTASHISKVVSSSIMPTIIENKQVTVDGIRDASIQNYAEIDVSIFTDGILRVTAWTSTNAIVGYQWLDNDNNTTFVSTSEHGGGMYTYEIIVPQNATKLQFSFFKEHGISVDATYTARIPVNVEVAKMAPVISLAGMDGAVNTADSISNEEFKIKDICDKRGITLILVRHAKLGEQAEGKDWQTKNSIALSLGLRYVDMYKAVTGNELTHDWYEGYLSSDGVHPTALGAKAEAMRILCDIPEITQYN